MGDLLEISATRGRHWFWIAYSRTLISLGWRTPVAFVGAIVGVRFMYGTGAAVLMLFVLASAPLAARAQVAQGSVTGRETSKMMLCLAKMPSECRTALISAGESRSIGS
jgi:hypothetical protein